MLSSFCLTEPIIQQQQQKKPASEVGQTGQKQTKKQQIVMNNWEKEE